MKKNEPFRELVYHSLKKILLIMRIVVVLLLFGFLQIHANNAWSQKTRLSINFSNTELVDVLDQIENETEFLFLYNEKLIDPTRKVSIHVQDQGIEDVLRLLFANTDVKYSILDRKIILSPSENVNISQQQKSISGKVTDSSGVPLPGVTIVIKGTTQGIITDAGGNYSLSNVPADAILVFSFVGMSTQEIPVAGKTTINVALEEEAVGIGEVVVTALGIERSKKTLTYATQQVNMESLITVKEVNLGNALAGKVAGVSVTSSNGAGGVSGDPRIIIRGDRSINNNNEPLIVIDGIPFSNSGSGLSGINPDDVESINVLKGPAASVLYGSSANNGVIVVTTKKGKAGKSTFEINSVTTFDFPYLYPEYQNEYAQGLDGNFMPNVDIYSWGPKMTGQTVTDWTGKQTTLEPQPNNVKDLFKIGYNALNTVSYSTGIDKSTAYVSYSNTTARGILETNEMQRHNFNLRLASEVVKDLKMDFRVTYFYQHINDNVDVGDQQFSVMHQLNRMPRSLRTSDIKEYFYFDEENSRRQYVWAPDNTNVNNPYWAMYANETPTTLNQVNALVSLKYNFTDWLYFQLRGGMNTSSSDSEEKSWWDTKYIWSGKGDYTTSFSKSKNMTGDALLAFDKQLTKNFRLGINLGAEIKDLQNRSMTSNAGGLTAENKFALSYGANPTTSDSESRIQKQAVYGMAHLEFKDYLFLDVTARNDWSSTLPSPYDYFYPSVGLTGILSEMIALPELISFFKLRGSYAEVGNDASFAQIFQTYSATAEGPVGFLSPSDTRVPVNLIPEKSKSWEAGAEIRLLEDRLGVDFTWYKSNTYNQLILVTSPPSSGFVNGWINCGNIQNKGIEMIITLRPVKTSEFNWNIDLNFARNKNKVIELSETIDKYEIATPSLAEGNTYAIVGKPFGEIYTKGFVRNEAGQIVVDASGMPSVESDFLTYLGNHNYDWRSSINSYLSYKKWNLSFLIDLNYGGIRVSSTEAQMLLAGTSKASLNGREDGLIVEGVKEDGTPNDIKITAQAYAQLIGGRISSGSGETFKHDATNSRLRELSLGYSVPLRSNTIKALQLSLIGRNLFYIYNGCKWFDPDNTYDPTKNGQGNESAFLPGTRTVGIGIKLVL